MITNKEHAPVSALEVEARVIDLDQVHQSWMREALGMPPPTIELLTSVTATC